MDPPSSRTRQRKRRQRTIRITIAAITLSFAALALFASHAQAAPNVTPLASIAQRGSVTTATLSTPTPVVAGSTVLVAINFAGELADSVRDVTDPAGNEWTPLRRSDATAGSGGAEIWAVFVTNSIAGGSEITVDFDAPTGAYTLSAFTASGVLSPTLGGIDASGATQATGSAIMTSVTTTKAGDALFAVVGTDGPSSDGYTASGPLTLQTTTGTAGISPNATAFVSTALAATAGPYALTATLGASRAWHASIVALLASDGVTPVPVATSPPVIGSAPAMGDALVATPAVWSSSPSTVTQFWSRCDASGNACQPITGATSLIYTPTTKDRGSTLKLTQIGTNQGGSTATVSTVTPVVIAQGYIAHVVGNVSVRPNATDGAITLTQPVPAGDTLVFSVSLTTTASFSSISWGDMNGSIVSDGDNGFLYGDGSIPTTGVVVQFVVRPLHVGDVFAFSSDQPMSLVNADLLDVSGVLTPAEPFFWTGTNSPGVTSAVVDGESTTYDRSLVIGTLSSDVTTGQGYAPQSPNQHLYASLASTGGSPSIALFVQYQRVLAAGSYANQGTLSVPANWLMIPLPLPMIDETSPPVNTVAPTISGTTQAGQTLSVSSGTWTGGPTYQYYWQTCDSDGTNCTNVADGSASYTVQPADVGSDIVAVVVGTNRGGSVVAFSAQTQAVAAAAAPANTTPPSISGTTTVGQILSASTGVWTGNPTSYSYAWQRCDASGNDCASISGATAATYALVSADIGSTVRVIVTATNASGSTPAASLPSAVIADAPAISMTLSTLGYNDTARQMAGPWSVGFGGVLPGNTRQIGVTGSGQQLAGPAIDLTVTSSTQYAIQMDFSDFSDGAGDVEPVTSLSWKHHGVSESWTPFVTGTANLDTAQPPGTADHGYDLSLTVPTGQHSGSYSTTDTITALATP